MLFFSMSLFCKGHEGPQGQVSRLSTTVLEFPAFFTSTTRATNVSIIDYRATHLESYMDSSPMTKVSIYEHGHPQISSTITAQIQRRRSLSRLTLVIRFQICFYCNDFNKRQRLCAARIFVSINGQL